MRMNAVLSNPKHPEYGQFTPGEVTQEQIDHAANGMVACPCCRRWSPFRCVEQTENTEENKIGMEMIPR